MDRHHYGRLMTSERLARSYLEEMCFPDRRPYCPRCTSAELWFLRDGRYRCSRCKYTFHVFSGRWINHGRLSPVQWLRLAGFFQLGHPVRRMISPLGVCYTTAYEAVRVVRLAVWARREDAGPLVPGAWGDGGRPLYRMPRDYGEVPVFGIWWYGDRVRVGLLPRFSADTLLGLSVPMERFGRMVFVRDVIGFEGLVFYEPSHLRAHPDIPLSADKATAGMTEGFWGWAKRRLKRYRGITYGNFPLYLKEMEFRFNNGSSYQFIQNVLLCLCRLKPRPPVSGSSQGMSLGLRKRR